MENPNSGKKELISFAHFTLFRKAIERKKTGMLAFITQLGFAGRIFFIEGQLLEHVADVHVTLQLKHFFNNVIQEAYWKEEVFNAVKTVVPTVILSEVLEKLTWNDDYCHNLAAMLKTLPVMSIESIPLQFKDYHIELYASLSQRQSLALVGFRPLNFLAGVSNTNTLSVRLKVLLLAYVCDLMKSIPQKRRTTQRVRKRPSVALRIFQRITGIEGRET